MGRGEQLPSESEWLIMETLWNADGALTSAEITARIPKSAHMDQRMVRVLINRLCKKGMLSYTIDEHDSRVYHYTAERTSDELIREKSREFVDSYFKGDRLGAAMTFLKSGTLTEAQIAELEDIIRKSR